MKRSAFLPSQNWGLCAHAEQVISHYLRMGSAGLEPARYGHDISMVFISRDTNHRVYLFRNDPYSAARRNPVCRAAVVNMSNCSKITACIVGSPRVLPIGQESKAPLKIYNGMIRSTTRCNSSG